MAGLLYQYVLRFQISIHDPMSVQVLQCEHQLRSIKSEGKSFFFKFEKEDTKDKYLLNMHIKYYFLPDEFVGEHLLRLPPAEGGEVPADAAVH